MFYSAWWQTVSNTLDYWYYAIHPVPPTHAKQVQLYMRDEAPATASFLMIVSTWWVSIGHCWHAIMVFDCCFRCHVVAVVMHDQHQLLKMIVIVTKNRWPVNQFTIHNPANELLPVQLQLNIKLFAGLCVSAIEIKEWMLACRWTQLFQLPVKCWSFKESMIQNVSLASPLLISCEPAPSLHKQR